MNDRSDMTRAEHAPDRETEAFLARVRTELDAGCDGLDGHTRSQLNAMRHRALAQKAGTAGARRGQALLLPFGGLATACVLVLALTVMLRTQTGVPGEGSLAPEPSADPATPLEDMEILSSSEELDFYENYDFYQWLADNDVSV